MRGMRGRDGEHREAGILTSIYIYTRTYAFALLSYLHVHVGINLRDSR